MSLDKMVESVLISELKVKILERIVNRILDKIGNDIVTSQKYEQIMNEVLE